uniref:Replication protein A 70 kDa DNA-binding subunit B n=1 Tax=Tanacetum cinerariifolium TaxID=118510 RepID=A0A699GG11_TANCI|nr:replication protein A 70 kDa DNA-binding subunit B [Tanacetum cinerariifolium]
MQPLRQLQRLSKSHKYKNSGVYVSNSESPSTGGQSEQKKNKKRSSISSSAKPVDQIKKFKLCYALEFDSQANRGSKSKTALKSPLKRNNRKNVSIFECSPQAPKMKERIITPIKDINPMIANMTIKGRCNSIWHSHKLNEIHDPYSLDCVFQDERDVISTLVSIGDIVPVNGYGCSKIRRTVVVEVTCYEANKGYSASEFKIKIHNPNIHVVTPAEFMQGCLRKMVRMIRDIELETYCVVYATIYIIQYENGWAYTTCKACNTKVTPIQSKVGSSSRNKKQLWHRKIHGETYAVVSRFKIIVCIFDESGSTQVVLFDNNVYKMTKLSAWQIMEEQWMDANQYFHDNLNQIIRKQYLFKIKYSQFNHNNNSHVYRAKKDEDEDYDCESDEINEDEECNITSQQNEENDVDDHTVENEKDDHTSPSIEINERNRHVDDALLDNRRKLGTARVMASTTSSQGRQAVAPVTNNQKNNEQKL